MATLLQKANQIKAQKDTYLLPENLKAGITCLGVTGNYNGLDTSDADATATDILTGKTAYVDGEKITGTGNGTIVSNIDLNVFLQDSEPATKYGVWIKDGETTVSGTEFLYHDALQEEFIDNRDVRFLRNDINCIGQIIVNNYLYTFGATSGSSKKFNLKTKEITTLNTPNIYSHPNSSSYTLGSSTGACYYANKIYIFLSYYGVSEIFVFCYDINSDTASRSKIGNIYSEMYWYSNINIYNGVAYFLSGIDGTGSTGCKGFLHSYNFSSGAYTQTQVASGQYIIYGYNVCNNITDNRNEFIYFVSSGKIYQFDVTNRTSSVFLDMTTSATGSYLASDSNCGIYCTSEYIYVFKSGASTYCKVSFADKSVTSHSIGFSLQIKSSKDYGSNGRSEIHNGNQIILDDLTGKLYFRTSNAYYKGNPSCMQLYSEKHLGSNKVVVQLSNSYPFLKLENTTGLYSGVKDTYLIKDNVITTDHMMCYGDGVTWDIIKNPNNETCTVTFDTDGGTGTFESQTFVCGNVATEPLDIPTKQGFVFDAWYLNGDVFNFTRKVLSDITLTAHYIEEE